jgi:transcriptional regulator with XRE-family HTH domain
MVDMNGNLQFVVGRKVRARRRALGLSQIGLASACHLHFTYVSEIERGEHNVTVQTIARLADGLHTTPAVLLQGIGRPSDPYPGGEMPPDRQRGLLEAALRQVRLDAGLAQGEMAARLGVSQSYVSKYERGQLQLDFAAVGRVCRAAGTTMRDFVRVIDELSL